MKFKQLEDSRFVLVFETGDEVMEELASWSSDTGTTTASFTGIGALSEAEVGFFNSKIKGYARMPVLEQTEVLSIIGNISLAEGRPRVHAHVVLSRQDGSAIGGHLFSARVRPTLEVFLTVSPGDLTRTDDPESGLPLIDLI